jgi:hypothetical protein
MRTTLYYLFLAAASWGGAPPQTAKPAPAAAVRPASDAIIEADIRARFQRSKIKADNFTVKVQGGIATIEGKTKVIQRKGAATRLAKLGGARAVNNKIEVDEAAREKAANNLEKGRRRAQIKRGEVRTEATGR